MRTIAAIRTHVWTDQEYRLLGQLAPIFGDDLRVVFHNRRKDQVPPIPAVDLTNEWVKDHGLRLVRDYGWRCGDYFLYALREKEPHADYYWLIEPDVFFSGQVSDFFDKLSNCDADLVGIRCEELKQFHRWVKTLNLPGFKSVFALTRVSGRAIDYLLKLRQDYGQRDIRPPAYCNDEIFVWSHIRADDRFTTAELVDLVPEWTDKFMFRADPDILLDTLIDETSSGVYHPVQSRPHYIRAVGKRVANSLVYLERMKDSLAHLNDEEMQQLLSVITTQVNARLLETRQQGRSAGRLDTDKE